MGSSIFLFSVPEVINAQINFANNMPRGKIVRSPASDEPCDLTSNFDLGIILLVDTILIS